MPFMQLVVGADAEGHNVVLQLNRDGAELGHVALNAEATQAHIDAVSLYRAQLKTQVPDSIDLNGRVEATNNPVWQTVSTEHGPALMVRHPGLGWIPFLFPTKEARSLGQALIDLADTFEAKT